METEIALCCGKMGALAFLFYGGFIIGQEIRGREDGYPGQGLEMHEHIMRTLKEIFLRNNPPKK